MTMPSPIQKWPGLSLFLPVFCAVLVADQISKQIMLDLVFNPPRYIEIGLMLNIVPVWNSGMSFGMLADGGLCGAHWFDRSGLCGEWLVRLDVATS